MPRVTLDPLLSIHTANYVSLFWSGPGLMSLGIDAADCSVFDPGNKTHNLKFQSTDGDGFRVYQNRANDPYGVELKLRVDGTIVKAGEITIEHRETGKQVKLVADEVNGAIGPWRNAENSDGFCLYCGEIYVRRCDPVFQLTYNNWNVVSGGVVIRPIRCHSSRWVFIVQAQLGGLQTADCAIPDSGPHEPGTLPGVTELHCVYRSAGLYSRTGMPDGIEVTIELTTSGTEPNLVIETFRIRIEGATGSMIEYLGTRQSDGTYSWEETDGENCILCGVQVSASTQHYLRRFKEDEVPAQVSFTVAGQAEGDYPEDCKPFCPRVNRTYTLDLVGAGQLRDGHYTAFEYYWEDGDEWASLVVTPLPPTYPSWLNPVSEPSAIITIHNTPYPDAPLFGLCGSYEFRWEDNCAAEGAGPDNQLTEDTFVETLSNFGLCPEGATIEFSW